MLMLRPRTWVDPLLCVCHPRDPGKIFHVNLKHGKFKELLSEFTL